MGSQHNSPFFKKKFVRELKNTNFCTHFFFSFENQIKLHFFFLHKKIRLESSVSVD